jgi:septum formation protein
VTREAATKADTSKRPVTSTNNRPKPIARIVLASQSPRRRELLRSIGLAVEVAHSGYEEAPRDDVSPNALARYHAHAKLAAYVQRRQSVAIAALAADTVVDLDGRALGKPADAQEAVRLLETLSGREHLVHTAFALALPETSGWIEECSTTRVRFYALTAPEIAEYVATGEPLDKAGAYGIQGRAAAFVEAIEGDFYTVMGLPLARFIRALKRSGFTLPDSK